MEKDADKLKDDFRKLGKHLSNASSAYDRSDKRLDLFNEKVKKLTENNLEELEGGE